MAVPRVRVIVLGLGVCRHMAPIVGQDAGQVLELNSAVMNAESAEDLIDPLQNTVTSGWWHVFDKHM